jgi:hypothetical protein
MITQAELDISSVRFWSDAQAAHDAKMDKIILAAFGIEQNTGLTSDSDACPSYQEWTSGSSDNLLRPTE